MIVRESGVKSIVNLLAKSSGLVFPRQPRWCCSLIDMRHSVNELDLL